MTHDLLESLDDPMPYDPPADLTETSRARGRRLRRRRRLGITGAAIPIVVVLALVAGVVYIDRRTAGVARVDAAAGVLSPVAAGAPYNILVVGFGTPVSGPDATDSPQFIGPYGFSQSSDTMVVVRIDPAAGRITLLSLPRDLVFAGATSLDDRLSDVQPRSGVSGLITTIRDHLGIDIAHFVEVDFQGFSRLINAAGGISIQASTPLRDANTGMTLDTSCQKLDGIQTLGLVRARHIEYQLNGRWTPDPLGGLGRMDQQRVVLSLLVTQLSQLPNDLVTVNRLLDVFVENTAIDSGLSRQAVLDLGRWGRTLQPGAVESETLPVMTERLADGADMLTPTADAPAAVASFTRGELTPTATPTVATAPPPFSIAGC